MNKSELVEAVANQAGTTKAEAGRVLDALFAGDGGVISQALRNGERIQIPGFGSFERRDRKARTGRNPSTGETITIPASKVPAFKAAQRLKDAL